MEEAVFAAPTLAAALGAVGVWVLRRTVAALPAAIPNARSLHVAQVPRSAGFAVWLGFLPVAVLYPPPIPGGWVGWLPAWLALVIVSGFDDVREVAVVPRLTVHAAASLWAALWLLLSGATVAATDASTLVLVIASTALAIAWSANLFNFMDGTDGLACTMGIIGFAAYGFAALAFEGRGFPGVDPVATARACAPAFLALAAALVPVLVVNRPRASMFLGDAGAVPLGFLAAVFGTAGTVSQWWPVWFPLLVFLPFVADATLTLAVRIRRRERLWEGHRNHYYQRLHQLGAGHGGTLAVYAVLMAGTAATALACLVRAPAAGWWALLAWIAVVTMLFATIDYHWRKKTNIPAPS